MALSRLDAVSTAEVFRWTAEQFELAGEAGLFSDERVELLDGEVYVLAPMLPAHAAAVRRLSHFLVRRLDPGEFTVGGNDPVRLDERSEPLPDVWVARGPEDDYRDRHPDPADLVLAVEVAASTLRRDERRKVPAYAAAGLVTLWVVALGRDAVLEHREPEPESRGYLSVRTFGRGETLLVPHTEVNVPVDLLLA